MSRLVTRIAAICALALLLVGTARAAATVSAPAGWSEDRAAQEAAQRRASAWATAAGYRLVAVMSTAGEDDFAETLAVLEIFEPLAEDAVADPENARQVFMRAAGRVVDSVEAPADFSVESTAVPGASILRGSWEVGEQTFLCALAPSGPTQTLIVMVAQTQEISLHTVAFDATLSSVDGVTAPVTPFPRTTWRMSALLGWLLVAGVAFGVVVVTADRSGDHARNGQRVAVVLIPLAVVTAIAVYTVLSDRGTALALANVSREWMAIEMSALGFGLAALLWLGGRLASGGAVVESAPSRGVYAGRKSPGVPRLYSVEGRDQPTPVSHPAPPQIPAVDLPSDVGEAQLETHSLAPDARPQQSVDEDMATRVAPAPAHGGKIEERRPRPVETFRHGGYSITRKDD